MAVSKATYIVVLGLLLQCIAALQLHLGNTGDMENNKGIQDFGHSMLSEFVIQPGFTNLNHGSYGSTPRKVLNAQNDWIMQMEASPDEWFRYQLRPLYNDAISKLAKYVKANESDVILTENASTAVNAVLRSIPLSSGSKVMYFNTAYGMVKQTLQYISSTEGVVLVQVDLKFPATNEDIINTVKTALDQNTNNNTDGSVKFAVFSHITSTPAVILPVKELVALFRSYGVITLVDGAHAVGQIPLDVTDLNPDFYLSNAHKWLYAPKGAAFLWARLDKQNLIHPTVISFGYTQGLQEEFYWTGTRDYSSVLSIVAALSFREELGDERIMNHNHELAVLAGRTLAKMWNTEMLVDESMIGAMVNVRLPMTDPSLATQMVNDILARYRTYLVAFQFQDTIYARISCQIYNELSDIEMVGKAVLEYLATHKPASHS